MNVETTSIRAVGAGDELDTKQAAEFLKCSEGYLIKLRGMGGGPPFFKRYVRRGIYYRRSDLEQWKVGTRYLSTTGY